MKRREFIRFFAGAALVCPFAARAQQDGRVRRIGILDRGHEADRPIQIQQGAMQEELARRGWIEGHNVRFVHRFTADDPERLLMHAEELVRLAPDVVVASSLAAARALQQRTQTIPIVFFLVGDPVAGGLLQNIARPEGNMTGVTNYQSLAGKWLELLKEAAPRTARIALVFVPGISAENYFAVMDTAAGVLGAKAIRTPYRNAVELERAVDVFAAEPNGGLVLVPPPPALGNRELVNRLAIKYRLPTIYSSKWAPAEGGLMGYGADAVQLARLAASYVDRILRGAKITELPVQFSTKFDLVINLKTAKAIGLEIPPTLRARADEVIE